MSTCKANHWGWAVPWELEPVCDGECCLSRVCFLQSFQQRQDWTFHPWTWPVLRRAQTEMSWGCLSAAVLRPLAFLLQKEPPAATLPLPSLLCRCLPAPSLLSGFPLHALLSVNREGTVILCFCSLSYLFLESTGLLLKSCCSEIIDDVHHSPVCRIGGPSIFHGTAKHRSKVSECGTNAGMTGSLPCPSGPVWASSLGACYSLPSGPIPIYPQKDSWCFFCVLVSCDHYSYWSSQWFLSKVFDF